MKRQEIPTPHPGHQQTSAAVTAALGTLRYPATKDEVLRKVGDWQIPWAEGQRVPLGQLLSYVPQETFPDVTAAQNAVDAHWGRIADMLGGAARTEQDAKAEKRRHDHLEG